MRRCGDDVCFSPWAIEQGCFWMGRTQSGVKETKKQCAWLGRSFSGKRNKNVYGCAKLNDNIRNI